MYWHVYDTSCFHKTKLVRDQENLYKLPTMLVYFLGFLRAYIDITRRCAHPIDVAWKSQKLKSNGSHFQLKQPKGVQRGKN